MDNNNDFADRLYSAELAINDLADALAMQTSFNAHEFARLAATVREIEDRLLFIKEQITNIFKKET